MTPLVVGSVAAVVGALWTVRFPSGARVQLLFGQATFALFLVDGLAHALLAVALAQLVTAALAFVRSRPSDRAQSMLATCSAPIAMVLSLFLGQGLLVLFGIPTPVPLYGTGALALCVALLVVLFATFTLGKELFARRFVEAPSISEAGVPHDRGAYLYAAAIAIAGPLQLLTHATYVLGGVFPWSLALSWGLFVNVAVAVEARTVLRTHRLARRLAIAERRAAVGEVTARVAHHVRHQVGLIGMSLHRIEERVSGLEDEDRRALGLELVRLESAQSELRRMLTGPVREPSSPSTQVGRLVDLVEGELRRCGTLAAQCDVALRLDTDASAELAIDEVEKLRQAFFNLLENAIVAARAEVAVHAFVDDGRATIQVDDDGPGMDDETMRRAVEPFFTTKEGGTGMGLAIARAVAEERGGSLRLGRGPLGGLRAALSWPVG